MSEIFPGSSLLSPIVKTSKKPKGCVSFVKNEPSPSGIMEYVFNLSPDSLNKSHNAIQVTTPRYDSSYDGNKLTIEEDYSYDTEEEKVDFIYLPESADLIVESEGDEDYETGSDMKEEKEVDDFENSATYTSDDEEFYAEVKKIDDYGDEYVKLSMPFRKDQYLPAYQAALKSDLESLIKIASMGIRLDAYDMKTGETPIHAAIRRGNVQVLRYILSKVKVDYWNPKSRFEGRTPFALACSIGNSELVMQMVALDDKFDTHTPDSMGRSPIMLAALNEHEDIFKLLLTLGFDYLHRDNNGDSLITLLPFTNPAISMIVNDLTRKLNDSQNCLRRADVIRMIAKDLSSIYNDKSRGYDHMCKLLNELGLTLEEVVKVPQLQLDNPLLAILKSKNYDLLSVDLNALSPTEFDAFSFMDRAVQVCDIDVIHYLFRTHRYNPDKNSITSAIQTDRSDVLDLFIKLGKFKFDKFSVNGADLDIISYAASCEADQCLSYLLKKYSGSEEFDKGTNLICGTVIDLCELELVSALKRVFKNLEDQISMCSIQERYEIQNLIEDLTHEDSNSDIHELYSSIRKINSASLKRS